MPINAGSQSVTRTTRPVRVAIGSRATLAGDLGVPARPRGLVILASGSVGTRLSPRNRFMADVFDHYALATLLVDLLTEEDEAIDTRTGRLQFDMALLAERIIAIGAWAQRVPQIRGLGVGLFGADTGAGAALVASAQQPRDFRAIVSYAGRPDLAGSALARVKVPTLFIVGAQDEQTVDLNRRAIEQMHNDARLEIVAGTGRLPEEADALEQVAALSVGWFAKRLR